MIEDFTENLIKAAVKNGCNNSNACLLSNFTYSFFFVSNVPLFRKNLITCQKTQSIKSIIKASFQDSYLSISEDLKCQGPI